MFSAGTACLSRVIKNSETQLKILCCAVRKLKGYLSWIYSVRKMLKRYGVELLGPNFQQKFAFGGRSVKFGVEILLTTLYLNIDRSKTF